MQERPTPAVTPSPPGPAAGNSRLLSVIAAISGVYDVAAGILMIFGRPLLSLVMGVPPPTPIIHADLNGLFLLAVGAGYYLPWRDPERYRGYLWVMGPGLKGAGAALFMLDHFLRASPASYLLFSVTDGTLAILTWWALTRDR